MVQYISKKKIQKLFTTLTEELEPETDEYKGLKELEQAILNLR